MTNFDLLNEKIQESGLMKKALAQKAGMTYYTLARRLNGLGEFKANEIVGLSKALNLKASEKTSIFFTDESE